MKTTLFLIFIADNIRHGNFPRVDGFKHSYEFQDLPYNGTKLGERYLYGGKALTAEEFNEAAKRLFSPDYRGAQDFTFQPLAIEVAAAAAPPVEIEVKLGSFELRDRRIFAGDEHVAGLFGDADQLRVLAPFQSLRPEIEAWLAGR